MRLLLFVSLLFAFVVAAAPVENIRKMKIKTSAICEMCKVSIEKSLFKLEGVKTAELDLVTKKVSIRYDSDRVDAATLRQAIASVGYDADEVLARPKAYDNLAACCKKGSSCDMPKAGGE